MAEATEGRIRLKRASEIGIEFNNTSMTDVIFILLIFFISLSQLRTSALQVKLPTVATSRAEAALEQAKRLVIEVSSQDRVFLDGTPVEPEEIAARLAAFAGEWGEEPRVRIRGDADARNGTIMRVVAALADAGLTKIEFAVKATEPR